MDQQMLRRISSNTWDILVKEPFYWEWQLTKPEKIWVLLWDCSKLPVLTSTTWIAEESLLSFFRRANHTRRQWGRARLVAMPWSSAWQSQVSEFKFINFKDVTCLWEQLSWQVGYFPNNSSTPRRCIGLNEIWMTIAHYWPELILVSI